LVIRNSEIYNIRAANPVDCRYPGLGILLSSGTGHSAYNNFIHDNDGGGVAAGIGQSNAVIANNTVYHNGFGLCGGGGIGVGQANGTIVENNISVNNTMFGIDIGAGGNDLNARNTVVQNNLTYGNGSGDIQNTGSNTTISNNITGNPNLTSDFHLQSPSPAINAGADLSSIFTTDKDGNTRIFPFDIGAYEYGGSGGGTPPPPPPASTSCQNLWNSTLAVPSGFGASFNLFDSAKELLINVLCSGSGETVNVGNSSSLEYIYNQGYSWSGTNWTPYTYSCSNLVSSTWCVGNASASLSLDPATKQSVLAYICDWNGTQWNCGCHDSSCTTNYWNLQQFKQ
jgi:Right handed beta helix region